MNAYPLRVMAGLDPAIHPLREKVDCRIKSGNDEREDVPRKSK
jgi:hypothetical protein